MQNTDRRGLYRDILESAVDFAIIALDTEGLVTEWNAGAEYILGWSAAEMYGQPADCFFTPEDRAADRAGVEMRGALEDGRALDERWHLRKGGARFWASGETLPLRTRLGEHVGYVKIVRDRTEQHEAGVRQQADAEFLRGVLGFSDDCIKVLDLDGKLLRMTEGGQRVMEVEDFEAIRGCTWTDFWEDEGNVEAREAVRLARLGGAGHFHGPAKTMAGTPKWWDVKVTPILDAAGKPESLLAISRDVTPHHLVSQRQAALIELFHRLRSCSTPIDVAHVAVDILGQTLGVDRTGYAKVDLASETLDVTAQWTKAGVSPLAEHHRFRDYGSYIDNLKRGAIVRFDNAAGDERTRNASDTLERVDALALVNIPLLENGALAGIFFATQAAKRVWTDDEVEFAQAIADGAQTAIQRLQAEARLRVIAATLEDEVAARTADRNRLWQLSTDIMLVADFDGIITAINPAWKMVLGWTEEDLIGHSLFDLIHPEDLQQSIDGAAGLAEGTTLVSFDNRYRHKDGSYHLISWTAVPGDNLINAVGRDLTVEREQAEALRAAEDALRQSQKMEAVGQLTGGLAHDFNNLLTGMMGNLELLQARIARGRFDDVDRLVNAAQGAGRRAAALTHRLLAFSRRQTLDPRPTDVNRLITGMEELLRRTVGPATTIEIVGSGGLWTAMIDAGQLENALLNLCINARDAMPDGGRITIETSNKWFDDRGARERDLPPGQYLGISVTDTGTGMSAETISRAFDPFFTTKPIGQGTGLGLSMIYGFARQSGGQVRVYSEVGLGTTFSIYLPRHMGDAEPFATEVRDVETTEGTGETVLIIDDEASIRHLVDEVLDECGYTVIGAPDGASGLKVLESGARIQLLITDVGLPNGMNGRQVADAARVLRPDLKILFITGYAENAAVGNGHLLPGMELLTKPFTMHDLSRKVRDMLTT